MFTNCNSCAALGVLGGINFISLNVSGKEHGAALEWETDESADNYVFTIERSVNGKDFYVLAYREGSSAKHYSYMDTRPGAGTSYYRIIARQRKDGAEIRSKIIPYSSTELKGLNVVASYSGQSFYISLPEGETPEAFSLYDLSGKNIPVVFYTDNNTWRVKSLWGLTKQLYIIKAITRKGVYTQKVMIM